MEPEHSGDEVGYALKDLQDDVEKEIDRSNTERHRAVKEKEKVTT